MAIGSEVIVGKIGSIIEVPSQITDAEIGVMVENAKITVENITGASIDLSDIGSSFQGVLLNLGAAHVLSKATGLGTDFTYRIGNFGVDKGNKDDPNQKQIQFYLDQASRQMARLGMPIRFNKTEPFL